MLFHTHPPDSPRDRRVAPERRLRASRVTRYNFMPRGGWSGLGATGDYNLEEGNSMWERNKSQKLALRGVAITATAIGAVAVGAFAIGALAVGALAIGRLAIRRLSVENANFKSFEIEELTVKRLRAAEVTVTESLEFPDGELARRS